MTGINDFVKIRKKEKEEFNLNGYENGDFNTNGELCVINKFKDFYGVFCDIGANNGLITDKVLQQKDNTQILCFEANPKLTKTLKIKYSKNNNIDVIGTILSDKSEVVKFYIHPEVDSVSSVCYRKEMMPSFAHKMKPVKIRSKRIDDFAKMIASKQIKKGLFLKIDVEGAEFPVMRGGKRVLDSASPTFVLFEYSLAWKETENKLRDALHFLDKLDYKMFRITPLGLESIKFYTNDMDNLYYCNYFAVKNFDVKTAIPKEVRLATKFGYTSFFAFSD